MFRAFNHIRRMVKRGRVHVPNAATPMFANRDEKMSGQTSMIVLATTNPKLCDETFHTVPRYNDVYRVEATEVYHVHDNPTASVLWPQVQKTYNLLTATGPVVVATNMPAKIPLNQFVLVYQNALMCRMIRSYKNGTGAYWFYNVLNENGTFTFTVPILTAGVEPFQMRPAGMVYQSGFGQLALTASTDRAAAQGLFGLLAAGDLGFITNIAAAGAPRDGPTDLSSGFYYGDRNFVYADGTPNNPGVTYGIGTTAVNQTSAATVAQVGQFLTGCYIFYWITPPAMGVGKNCFFGITMLGYNEQQETMYTTASGTVTTAQALTNSSFAAIPAGFDDYYRWDITLQSDDSAILERAQVGVMYVGTGEGWSHLPTFQVDTVQNEIEGSGWVSTTGLCSNTTAPLTRGGLQAGLQPPNKVEWQSLVDTLDPFGVVTDKFGSSALPFDRGGYAWLRPTDDDDYRLKEEIIDASGLTGTTRVNTYRTRLDNQPFMAHVLNNDNLSQVQSVLFDFHQTGEFSTDTQWRHPEYSNWSQSAWKSAAEALKHVPQLTVNDKHDYITSIGSGLGVSQGTIDSIKKWIARLMPVGQAALQALLAV